MSMLNSIFDVFMLVAQFLAVVFLLPAFIWGIVTGNKGVPGTWMNRVFLAQPGTAQMLYLWGIFVAVHSAITLAKRFNLTSFSLDPVPLAVAIPAGLVLIAGCALLGMGIVKERRQRQGNGVA